MTTTSAERFKPADGVHARRFDETLVILDLARGQYFGLDEVAARIWEELVAGHPLDEVVDLLRAEYVVDESQLRKDVSRIARDLLSAGLLVADSPPIR